MNVYMPKRKKRNVILNSGKWSGEKMNLDI